MSKQLKITGTTQLSVFNRPSSLMLRLDKALISVSDITSIVERDGKTVIIFRSGADYVIASRFSDFMMEFMACIEEHLAPPVVEEEAPIEKPWAKYRKQVGV